MSKTKLLVIDTQTRVVHSFEGNYRCGEAHLPADEDLGPAAGLIEELNGFREMADERRYKKEKAAEELAERNKAIMALHHEYAKWFQLLIK
jgi:hypothetical protein